MISLALEVVVLPVLEFVRWIALALVFMFVSVAVFVGGSQSAEGAGVKADINVSRSSLVPIAQFTALDVMAE